MVMQERRRREPFVTELREVSPCPDAPHWRLEGSLRCEYDDVKGGVLADAIGYGKTACTIGLIDCTRDDTMPQVPAAFKGFIPTRATLVLAPTNLHAQWLAEITKFTGETLKVISVPTCAQLKKIAPKELMDADVVVATYRLFYSTPYLQHLQNLAKERLPGFAFPRLPSGAKGSASSGASGKITAEWAKAYRDAFETLPAWGAHLQGLEEDPVTPARPRSKSQADRDRQVTPQSEIATQPADISMTQASEAPVQMRRITGKKSFSASQMGSQTQEEPLSPEPKVEKARKRQKVRHPEAEDAKQARTQKESPAWAADAQYMPLEAFWWKRVVCDEFHELLSRYPPAQVAVELFHAEYKWGLSGTPPCQNLAQIRKAAGFLGVQIPSTIGADDGGEAPRKVAQEWLDAFARRNTFELPTLEEEERIVPVHLTPKERALYIALTEQQERNSSDGLEEPPEIQAARQSASGLLKLCSHFCPSGASDVLTAEDECERQLVLRREQVRNVEREIRNLAERAVSHVQLVRHFEPHFCRRPDPESKSDGVYGFIFRETRPAVASRCRFLGASTTGAKAQLIQRFFEALAEPGVAEQAKEIALRVDFDGKSAGLASKLPAAEAPTWASLEASMCGLEPQQMTPAREMVVRLIKEVEEKCNSVISSGGAPSRCTRLRSRMGMPRWPRGGIEAQEDGGREFREAEWEWLADGDNAQRLRKVVMEWKAEVQRCATRILELESMGRERLQNLRSFQDTLHASQVAMESMDEVATEPAAPRFAKYGSKIESLVKHILKLQKADSKCKIICFVQWEDLKRKISAALEEFEIEHLTLHGSVWARRTALVRFQYEADSPRMLILSLEESASGTNLTAANHVIIVHPMEAATKDEAVAFEMQAVGRVRRPGQQRKIHIWRFVTVGTIEQQITEEHQHELWERQQAGLLLTQAGSMSQSQFDIACHQESDEDGEELADPMAGAHQDSATQVYVPALPARGSTEAPAAPMSLVSSVDAEADTLPFGLQDETVKYSAGCGGASLTQCYQDENATQAYDIW